MIDLAVVEGLAALVLGVKFCKGDKSGSTGLGELLKLFESDGLPSVTFW